MANETAPPPEEELDDATQVRLWNAWAESGPQGPIEDEWETELSKPLK